MDENVVICCVSDGAANDTDGKRESGDSSNEIIRANDGRDDRGWNDYPTDSQATEDKETPSAIQGVGMERSE